MFCHSERSEESLATACGRRECQKITHSRGIASSLYSSQWQKQDIS